MPSVIQKRPAAKRAAPSTSSARAPTSTSQINPAHGQRPISAEELASAMYGEHGVLNPEARLKKTVDDLGKLKAKISDLTAREKTLKEILVASGKAEIDGELFRATVSESTRETLDSDKVRGFLSPQQLHACTKVANVTTVRVSARVRET